MSHRLAPVLVIALAAGFVAACSGSPTTSPSPVPVQRPSVVPAASPTPGVVPSATATSSPTEPAPSPEAGNVEDLPLGPVLSVESLNKRSIRVSLDDIDAKAWRIVVAGTDARARDRLEVTVETGDVEAIVSLVEIRDGRVIDRADLSGFGDPTATAGRCHPSLGVCVDADGLVLPDRGDGHFAVELTRTEDVSLMVTGQTAGWPGEPFILGPWTATEVFPWEPGVTF